MRIFKKLTLFIILLLISISLGLVINCFTSNNFVFKLDLLLLFHKNTWIYGGEIFLIFACIIAWNWNKGFWHRSSKKLMNASEKDKHILSGLEQAHFQSDEEIAKNFNTYEYDKLPTTNIDGIPIKAEQIKNKLDITFAKNTHTLIIGTTGSGKTTSFVNPTIQILSNQKNKPSLLISDPKGELFSLHSQALRKRGYKVMVLDLRNPYNSVKWNPLERPYLNYQRMLRIESEVKINEEMGCYEFDGNVYYSEEEKNSAVQVKKQKIFDEVYEDLHDIVSVLCPVLNKSEPIWESGSKNFILAIALAMLEDSENKDLGMTKEKFNFYNLMKIATNTQNDCEELIRYFQGRSPISKSVSLSKQVLDASDKTRGSYLSTIFDKLSMFSDMSICSLTSSNEIHFGSIAEQPTALFLQIPDEKETRHTLASMVILQAYKELVSKANTFPDLALPRNVYFVLDEFGNLPRVHKLEQMITVGRSRKIWLCLVVQSYSQLGKVYDDKSADIIKSNCNIQIFIGTTDLKTIEDFSKLCGNYSIVQRNVSFSSGRSDDINSSASIKERPLIYPSELAQLNSPQNMGNCIVNVFGFSPIKSKFTPSFRCDKYYLSNTKQELENGRFFSEEKVFYNMLERNELICPKPNKIIRRNMQVNTSRYMSTAKAKVERLNVDIFKGEEQIEVLRLIDANNFDDAITKLQNISARSVGIDEISKNRIEEIIKEIENIKKLGGSKNETQG